MKNSIIFMLTFAYLIIAPALIAQQVISSGGGQFEGNQLSANWTIGEPVIETITGNNIILTQGFQQPFNFYLTQLLNIAAGWSGISAFIEPLNKNVEDLFSPFENNFIILSSLSQYYYPAGGVNTINDWNTETGYQIKTIDGFELSLTGSKISDPTVDLSAGWNLLPVLTLCGAKVASTLGTLSGLVIAKDVAGTGVYWPQQSISTLTDLAPGKSYWVAMGNPDSFTYPACLNKKTAPNTQENEITVPAIWGDFSGSASSHVIAFPAEVIEKAGLSKGSYIGAFTADGLLAGISQIDDRAAVGLTIFGDDMTAADKNGFSQGEVIRFKAFDPQSNIENLLEVEYDMTLPNGGFFSINGLSAVKSITGVSFSSDGETSIRTQLYPNPSDGNFIVTMSEWPSDLMIVLTDSRGQTVGTFFPEKQTAGSSLSFQLPNLAPGIYFLELTTSTYREVKKLIIN